MSAAQIDRARRSQYLIDGVEEAEHS